MARAASAVHADLGRGLYTLATLTCLAPFIGLLGTLWAIGFDTFFGLGTERSTGMAMVARGLSRACIPTALGLFVGIHSLWAYRYLQGRLTNFDGEMAEESLRVINQLARAFGLLRPLRPIESVRDSVPHLASYLPDPNTERRSKRFAWMSFALVLMA